MVRSLDTRLPGTARRLNRRAQANVALRDAPEEKNVNVTRVRSRLGPGTAVMEESVLRSSSTRACQDGVNTATHERVKDANRLPERMRMALVTRGSFWSASHSAGMAGSTAHSVGRSRPTGRP